MRERFASQFGLKKRNCDSKCVTCDEIAQTCDEIAQTCDEIAQTCDGLARMGRDRQGP